MEDKAATPATVKGNIVADALQREMFQVTAVHLNVAQEFIMITEDKSYRCLREWKDNIESRNAWIAPVTLAASLVLTFVTATFRDALGVSKDTWQAVFIIGIVLAAIWSVREITRIAKKKTPTIEELISELKKGAVVQRTTTESVALAAKDLSR